MIGVLSRNDDAGEVPVMLALHPRVDVIREAVGPLIPAHRPKPHPLGCHRRPIPDRVCFWGILRRLVTGCSWDVAGRISGAGETTLRRRRDEWTAAGVFEALRDEALAGDDRICLVASRGEVLRRVVERAKRNVGRVRCCPLARHALFWVVPPVVPPAGPRAGPPAAPRRFRMALRAWRVKSARQ